MVESLKPKKSRHFAKKPNNNLVGAIDVDDTPGPIDRYHQNRLGPISPCGPLGQACQAQEDSGPKNRSVVICIRITLY